jgi:hypothetical protein
MLCQPFSTVGGWDKIRRRDTRKKGTSQKTLFGGSQPGRENNPEEKPTRSIPARN